VKRLSLLLVFAAFVGCKDKKSLNSDDVEHVRIAVDLLKTRAALSMTADSTAVDSNIVKRALDSVYRLHHTNREQFVNWTVHLADDPKRAAVFYDAINDSIGK